MTEAEWVAGKDLKKMLEFLRGTDSTRKLRLFAVACCRTILNAHVAPPNHDVNRAELIADGLTAEQMRERPSSFLAGHFFLSSAGCAAAAVEWAVTSPLTSKEAWFCVALAEEAAARRQLAVRESQTDHLRDIFGNPFRPVSFDPVWRGPAVLALAQAAYHNRILPSGTLDPDRLAVLADALEEASCDNEEILGHLRGPGPHVRGCWAVDLLLGRE
jgi:hypothetical protein